MTSELQNEIQIETEGDLLEIRARGKLKVEFYHRLVPEFEKLIQEHGRIRVLFVLDDFHGWTAGAAWEDLKLGFRHFNDFIRIAIVGNKKWESAMTAFCKSFTTAKVKYFDILDIDHAKLWVLES